MKSALQSMSVENENLAHELAGARHTQRMLERLAAKARDDDAKRWKESPKTEKIKDLLVQWQTECGHPKAKVDSTTDRWKLVDKMLRRYDPETLKDAISYVGLFPYMRYGKRYAVGDRTERKSQLEHCIGTDSRVDDNSAGWRRQAREVEKGAEAIEQGFWQANAQEKVWGRLWMDALAAIEAGVEPGEPLEQFLRERRAKQGWKNMNEMEAA